jgi:hypothetical protein
MCKVVRVKVTVMLRVRLRLRVWVEVLPRRFPARHNPPRVCFAKMYAMGLGWSCG